MPDMPLVCKAYGDGRPHDRCLLAEVHWNLGDLVWMSIKTTSGLPDRTRQETVGVPGTGFVQMEKRAGYPLRCAECGRGIAISIDQWRDRVVATHESGASEVDVSEHLEPGQPWVEGVQL